MELYCTILYIVKQKTISEIFFKENFQLNVKLKYKFLTLKNQIKFVVFSMQIFQFNQISSL